MDQIPRVSVIIPTYNRAAWLLEAIASVRAQSFSDYELIIADDGSTDNTAECMDGVQGVRHYLRLPHSGRPSITRNCALDVARGELVAFLDDDDLWPSTKLEQQVQVLDENPDVGMVYGDISFLQADGQRTPGALMPAQKRGGRIFVDLIRDCFIHPSTVLVRRALLEAVGRFDERLGAAEDYDLWLRLAYRMDVVFVPTPAVVVRRHGQGVSQQRESQVAANVVEMLERTARSFSLSLRERLWLRWRRSRGHTHLALVLLDQNKANDACRHLQRSLLLNPLQRRAWQTLLGIRRP